MFIQDVNVLTNQKLADSTYLVEVDAPSIVNSVRPGQFFNILVSDDSFPLLRRPFSIADVIGNSIFFMYKVIGSGTKIISQKKQGDKLNLLGPLGNGFEINDSLTHYILIGGGIGIAPFPFFIKTITNKQYSVLFGVRNKLEVHNYGMENISYSSDDGSVGFHGNVISLLEKHIKDLKGVNIKILACGPNPMLKALQVFVIKNNIECDVSMESSMACGFGICQGCPIQYKNGESYKLICKDGPIFNIKDIEI